MHPANRIRGIKGDILSGKKIVLGVTGSIAAVETVKLARELIRYGADVYPVMTPAATKIIHPDALFFATGHRPVTELTGAVEHVELCGEEKEADLLLIAPATANTISKIAAGIDDTPVTTFATTAIGSGIPVLIVPAMHGSMYNHPKVRENIETLKEMGGKVDKNRGSQYGTLNIPTIRVTETREEEGKAKILNTGEIVVEVIRYLASISKPSRKILIIAGATEEPIDDMRVITNRSSGATGLYLAEAAIISGHEVELWLGRATAEIPHSVKSMAVIRRFTTVKSLMDRTNSGGKYDLIFVPAAISDYRPEKVEGKIPSGKGELSITLRGTPKIIGVLKERTKILVGFKAESIPLKIPEKEREKLLATKAVQLMENSGSDMVVANNLNEVTDNETSALIVSEDAVVRFSGTKKELAYRIMSEALFLLAEE